MTNKVVTMVQKYKKKGSPRFPHVANTITQVVGEKKGEFFRARRNFLRIGTNLGKINVKICL